MEQRENRTEQRKKNRVKNKNITHIQPHVHRTLTVTHHKNTRLHVVGYQHSYCCSISYSYLNLFSLDWIHMWRLFIFLLCWRGFPSINHIKTISVQSTDSHHQTTATSATISNFMLDDIFVLYYLECTNYEYIVTNPSCTMRMYAVDDYDD